MLLTYVSNVQYSCDIVLVFWFWREIVFDITYVLSVQYTCAVVSVFWLWQEIVLWWEDGLYSWMILAYSVDYATITLQLCKPRTLHVLLP